MNLADFHPGNICLSTRDIEWPLEAFASTRTVRLFISASTSSDQIFLASSEKIQMASSEQFINFPPAGISILFNENVFCANSR